MKQAIAVLIFLLTFSPARAGVGFGLSGAVKDKLDDLDEKVVKKKAVTATSSTPSNLALPVDVTDVSPTSLDPFGIIRWSLDSGVGHPGIDLTIANGDPIFAVADGTIISYEAATDGRGGSNLKVLIQAGTTAGTGWTFLYEHVDLAGGLSVGSTVSRGQQIGTSAVTSGNNHLELAYSFSNFEFTQQQTCWVDQLGTTEKASFLNEFNTVWRVDANFISYWTTNQREGNFPFLNLLNTTLYPNGAAPCYPKGTDVR